MPLPLPALDLLSSGTVDFPAGLPRVLAAGGVKTAVPGEMSEARLTDSHGRAITDLRLSVTDRCNYRCVYCRTGTEGSLYGELPLSEYARTLRLFVSLGIEKVRLTGGEPLLRSGLAELIREIATLETPFNPGAGLDIAITTNGHLLAGMAKDLKAAGLTRVTVSMDAMDAETFGRITRVNGGLEKVRAGIRAAQDVGLGPVKVNCVLVRGVNDSQIEAFAEFSRNEGVVVRFIEWMPLGEDPHLEPRSGCAAGGDRGTAGNRAAAGGAAAESSQRNRTAPTPLPTGAARSGSSPPVSQPLLRPLLAGARHPPTARSAPACFPHFEHDLVGPMRRGDSDDQLRTWIRRVIARKGSAPSHR